MDGDNPQTVLSRADAALYSAKAAGRNCVYRHVGSDIEAITPEVRSLPLADCAKAEG
jgi:hypothetical protein